MPLLSVAGPLISILIFFSVAIFGAFSETRTLVFTNVTVIDLTGNAPQQDMSVAIKGGKIIAIKKTSAFRVPIGAQIVDGRGKWLIPGLWDMHVHLQADREVANTPEALVSFGVTSVRDMGGHLDGLRDLSKGIDRGWRIGPAIYFAGETLNSEKPADFHVA